MIPLDQVPLLAESTRAVDPLADLSGAWLEPGLVVDHGHLEGLFSITDLHGRFRRVAPNAGRAWSRPQLVLPEA